MKELVKDVGKILKNKPANPYILVKTLHKISIELNTPDVIMFNLTAKGKAHLALVDPSKISNDFFPVVNRTSSPYINGINSIEDNKVHSSLSATFNKNIQPRTSASYYTLSYIQKDLVDLKVNKTVGKIAMETGVMFKSEQIKIFNLVLNKHRFEYLNDFVNIYNSKKFKKAIGLNKAKSISKIFIDNDKVGYKKLVGYKYFDFIKENDKDNMLLDFIWSDINDDFVDGFALCTYLFDKNIMLNLCNYGSEGLDYLDVAGNEINIFLDFYSGNL